MRMSIKDTLLIILSIKFGGLAEVVNAADWKSVDPGSTPGASTSNLYLMGLSSNGQDLRFSTWSSEFESPWPYDDYKVA